MILFATITGNNRKNDDTKGEPKALYDEEHIRDLFEQVGNEIVELDYLVNIYGAEINSQIEPILLAYYIEDVNQWINKRFTITKQFPSSLKRTR